MGARASPRIEARLSAREHCPLRAGAAAHGEGGRELGDWGEERVPGERQARGLLDDCLENPPSTNKTSCGRHAREATESTTASAEGRDMRAPVEGGVICPSLPPSILRRQTLRHLLCDSGGLGQSRRPALLHPLRKTIRSALEGRNARKRRSNPEKAMAGPEKGSKRRSCYLELGCGRRLGKLGDLI
jgi:hypothetical protein